MAGTLIVLEGRTAAASPPSSPGCAPTCSNGGGLSASEISPVRAGVLGADPDVPGRGIRLPSGDVNFYAASAFYAVDRYASYKKCGGLVRGGGLVLADRYTTSNAIHQASKVLPEEREAFFRWLYDFEYGKLGLPRPIWCSIWMCRRSTVGCSAPGRSRPAPKAISTNRTPPTSHLPGERRPGRPGAGLAPGAVRPGRGDAVH